MKSFHGRSGRNVARYCGRAVAEGATAELPASGPEARLGPIASYCSCAGAPRADGRRSTAAAGRRGRPRRSWGLPLLACVCGEAKRDNSLSLHVKCRECNPFCSAFVVLLHAKCLTGCLILMLHFLHFILLLSTFPSPVIK